MRNPLRHINGEDIFLLSLIYVPFGAFYIYLITRALLTLS